MDISNKIISHEIKITNYRATVIVLYSKTLTTGEIQQELCKSNPLFTQEDMESANESGDSALTISVPEERTIYLLFDKGFTINNLHHECIHITSFLFSYIQTVHSDGTDEVFAYLSDSIFSELYEVILQEFKIPKKSFLTIAK